MTRTLTGVGAVLCAAHRDVGTGKLHGHTWEITAWFLKGTDATIRACRLDSIVGEIDHGELPSRLSWGEDLAEWVGEKFDDPACVAVDVSRPAERIYARWER